MTRFDGIEGFSEAFINLKIGNSIKRGGAFHSFANRKNYFCLPSFAACSAVRDNICASQVAFHLIPIFNEARSFSTSSDPANFSVATSTKIEFLAPPQKKKKNRKRGRGKPTPTYGGINYGSISEAALGILLEELIPGFSVKEGQTFQLPLGQGRTVDFLINNTLIEFHYPRSYTRGNDLGDFKDYKEKRDFMRSLGRVGRNRHQRKKLLRTTHELLMKNYSSKRRKQIDNSVYGPHTELIVASTPQEFYWKVICRFVGLGAISENRFVERFEQCCKSVISTTKEAWKEAA